MILTKPDNTKPFSLIPVISILMPAYNTAKFIAESIQSIIYQEFPHWELIIIDDCSTDNTAEIINRFNDERIRCFRNEKNLGLIETLNKGITICRGKYIVRLDSDDIALPDRLKKQFEYMENHPETVLCGSNAYIIDESNLKIGRICNLKKDNLLKINLLFSVPFIHPSTCIKGDILKQNKYSKDYIYAEDYELWVRLSKLGKIHNIQDNLIEYRWHQQNTSIIHQQKQSETKNKIIEEQLKSFGIHPTKEELQIHRSVFELFHFGHKNKDCFADTYPIKEWLKKLTEKNKEVQQYNQSDLISFLWSRWITLCLFKKNYSKAINSGLPINPKIIYKTFKIILFLRKKTWKQKKN